VSPLLTRPHELLFSLLSFVIRWHEHDATEIQEMCDKVIEQAVVKLEEVGYNRSSVKVIGTS
jgi:hypothetical protein